MTECVDAPLLNVRDRPGDREIEVPLDQRHPHGGARGEIGVYLVSDGSPNPYRAKWRSSSFSSLSMIEYISPGLMIADLVAVIATMDTIAPEMDR